MSKQGKRIYGVRLPFSIDLFFLVKAEAILLILLIDVLDIIPLE